MLPLRLDVQVFSGIAPPKELLEAMAEAKASMRRRSTVEKGSTVGGKLQTDLPQDSTYSVPPTPMEAGASSAAFETPAQEGSRVPPTDGYFDAPPSYEDTMARDLSPPTAHRPEYEPPPAGEDNVLRGDEKTGFMGRRGS